LKQYAAAIDAYRACAALGGWAEEGAWACFRAAECCCALERWSEAIETCARGLAIRPATAELAWLAGWAAYKAKRYEDAIAWSTWRQNECTRVRARAQAHRVFTDGAVRRAERALDIAALGNALRRRAAGEWAAAKRARGRRNRPATRRS
jgi:tetratricopeptide (TPR) repeat protein